MHDLAHAVQDVLAPLKVADTHVYDRAVGYVVDGTTPDVLADVSKQNREQRGLVAKPDAVFPQQYSDEVAAVYPEWTREVSDRGRLAIYAGAPEDVLVRLGRLLHAASEAAAAGEAPWLLPLVDDAPRLAYSPYTRPDREAAAERWTPDFVSDLARAGGVPDVDAPRVVLSTLLAPGGWGARRHFVATTAGDFLARHAEELARITAELDANGREHVAHLCVPRREDHVGLLATLAVDEVARIRGDALAGLAWLDGRLQVGLLAPHLWAAATDRLPEIVARLSDLDGGLAAIEAALEAAASGPRDAVRERLLRSTADRIRAFRVPTPELVVPPAEPPADGELLDELRTRAAESRLKGAPYVPSAEKLLSRLADIRVLRDALAAAGLADADRKTAELLVTRTTGAFESLIGAVLTPQDAERWWPLFAERLDLVDEYLELADDDLSHREEPVDTTAMMLKILERFPAVPEVLVPRLTDFALGHTRHRHPARRALANHPRGRAIAEGGLAHEDAQVRASAAEWLAELGATDVAPPERAWEFGPSVLPEAVRALPAEVLDKLDRFREKALARDIPAEDVDRWLGLARPGAVLEPGGNGPAAARLGGPLMLPPDVPTPAKDFVSGNTDYHLEHQLIATIDLSALRPEATGLPTPVDGQVLLFANPDLEPEPAGGAVYVPAGTPVEERPPSLDYEPYEYDSPEDLDAELRSRGEFRVRYDVTLPYHAFTRDVLAAHPHARSLKGVWEDVQGEYDSGEWRVGGHAWDHEDWGDPVAQSAQSGDGTRPEDWVLLAQWDGLPMASLYWTIPRHDLAAGRFDRVRVTMYSNP